LKLYKDEQFLMEIGIIIDFDKLIFLSRDKTPKIGLDVNFSAAKK